MGVFAIPAAVQRNALSELSSREHSPDRRRRALGATAKKVHVKKSNQHSPASSALDDVRIELIFFSEKILTRAHFLGFFLYFISPAARRKKHRGHKSVRVI
jgi:hypothetical protein